MPKGTYREIPLTFNLGQISSYEASLLPDGAASLLENWVPEETGGVRVREGWRKSTTSGGPATAKGLGVGVFTSTRRIFRQRKTATGQAPNVTPTVTWDNPTKQGSTLLFKLTYSNNSGSTSLPDLQAYNGWQLLHFDVQSGVGAPPMGQCFIFVKENASPETSSSVPGYDLNPSNSQWMAEGVELLSVQTGTPKNLLPSLMSNVDGPDLASHATRTGWSNLVGGSTPTYDAANKKSGKTAIKSQTSSVFEIATRTGADGVPVSPNTVYTASLYLKHDVGNETFRARIKWYDNAGAFLSNSDGAAAVCPVTYQRYTATGTSPSNAAYAAVSLECTIAAGVARTRWFDEIQLELGSTATAWERGHITSIDRDAIGIDLTNPVTTTGGTSTVSSSWAEATIMSSEGTFAGAPSSSGWTNSFTEASDLYFSATNWESYLTSASKVIVGLASVDTAATIANIPTFNVWVSVVSVKLNTSEAIALDKFYIAAQDGTTTLDLFYISQSDVDVGPWALIESNAATPDGSPVAYASGLGSLLYTNTSLPSVRRWPGIGETPAALAPTAGTCIAFFKSRFFVGGTADQPTRLVYSDIGSVTSWPGTSFLEVGQDDGYTILDIATQENLLVIGKGNSIYTLSGSGPDTFFLYQMPSGDAAPGRSIAVTPSGAVVAGTKNVFQISGNTVDVISKNIGAAYSPAGRVHSAYADDHVFILDVDGQKVFVCDLRTQAWHVEKYSSASNQMRALINAGSGRLLSTPTSSTDTGLIMYRDHPSLTRTRDFSPLTSQAKLSTGVLWPVGPRETFTPRHLLLQIRQRGAGSEILNLGVSCDDSGVRTYPLENKQGSGVHRHRVDLGHTRGCSSIELTLTGPSSGTQFDVESAILAIEEEVKS